jgi:putative ATPase
MEAAEESIQKRAVLYDRDGDYHFDTISAFIKSIRGSDPDAALYWLAKMVRAGEDPSFIFRRMIILASEDVGLADPHALGVVVSCAEAFDRIGFPEGNFPLAHACLYLATAPKSNTAMAFFDALKEVDREDAEVPNHLRDASRDAEGFGHGEGYVYPHAYRDHWAAQQYLPTALQGRAFYVPSETGYEGKIREEVLRKRELQAAIVLGDGGENSKADGEFLTWSASAKGREGWFKRLESGRGKSLLADRDAIFDAAALKRHDRVLIPLANDGLLLWEALRRCPEGLTAALVSDAAAEEALLRYAAVLNDIERPEIAVLEGQRDMLPAPGQAAERFSSSQFEHILIRPGRLTAAPERLAAQAKPLLANGGGLILLASPPRLGERISRILREECGAPAGLAEALQTGEDAFFAPPALTGDSALTAGGDAEEGASSANNGANADLPNWDSESLAAAFTAQGFTARIELVERQEERLITEKDLDLWFNTSRSRWGAFMGKHLKKADFTAAEDLLRRRAQKGPLLWRWKSALLKAVL